MSWLFLPGTLLTTYCFLRLVNAAKRRAPLPPGPPSLPIIGHLLAFPAVAQDMFFYQLGKKYGDVIHLKVLNRSLIILNSTRAANDLLDRRGGNYQDRPDFPVFDLVGLGDTLAFLSDASGDNYRAQRKMFQLYFAQGKKDHRPTQVREAQFLARDLMKNEGDHLERLLRFATATLTSITYGHRVTTYADPYLKIIEDCSRVAASMGPPGSTPIDLFPFLRHFPSWFPGMYYANFARNASSVFRRLLEYPYQEMTRQMADGTYMPSFLSSLLEALRDEGSMDDEARVEQIKSVTSIACVAGAETTASTLSWFMLAILLYPEIQIKAQEEIDAVCGQGRLPDFSDRENLPYVECVLQETARWNHAAPSGVPHKVTEDEIYRGMLIPKGATVIANTRSMTLDKSVYADPYTFDPTRFLPAPLGRGEPTTTALYGFGRRKCPGRHLADESLWIVIATVLATLTMSRAIDENGNDIIPESTSISVGIASHPTPFKCRIEARNDKAKNLLCTLTE